MATFTSTAKYALRWLTGTNLVSDIDLGFQTLAQDVDAAFAGYAEGTFSALPAAGKSGRLYRCTDTFTVYMDTGSAWIPHGPAPGDIKASAVASAPSGWLLCDGTAVSRTGTNAALFAAISTVFGVGNGSTTFNVPDLRDRVPVGAGPPGGLRLHLNNQLAQSGGEDLHTLTVSEIPSHSHVRDYTSQPAGSAAGANGLVTPTSPNVGNVLADTRNTGGGVAHNNMPPYQVVTWLVKL